VQTSADLVHEAYVNGRFDQTHPTMLDLIPIAGGMAGPGDPVKGPQIRTSPLFYSDSYNQLHRRNNITDPTDYTFTENWWVATTAGAILSAKYLGIGNQSVPAPV
jgi:hypothetical protein